MRNRDQMFPPGSSNMNGRLLTAERPLWSKSGRWSVGDFGERGVMAGQLCAWLAEQSTRLPWLRALMDAQPSQRDGQCRAPASGDRRGRPGGHA